LQLAARVPVWALGGFSGHDPHPRLAEFITAARHHRVHYLLFTAADRKTASQAGLIARWAEACLPVHANGPWLVVDASRLAYPAATCGAAPPTSILSGTPPSASPAQPVHSQWTTGPQLSGNVLTVRPQGAGEEWAHVLTERSASLD
jgi:hypothetical protein